MSEAENVLLPAKFPLEWPITTVGAQFHIILGKMLDVEKNVGTRKPYLGNRSVQWGHIDVSDLDMIKLTDGDIRKYRLQRGDLLVCEGGDIGRAAIWQDQLEECYFQKALHRLRPRGDYSSVLMRYLLEYYAKTGFLVNFATQTSIAHLPKDKFVTVPLPLPPFHEQQAIAAALSDADGVVAGLERVIAKKRLIKQGAMQDLLTARRRLPGFSGEWEVKRLGELGQFFKGSGVRKDKAKSGVLPCVRYGELYTVHHDVVRHFTSHISEEVAQTACKVRRGDILFAGSGETKEEIGKCAAVDHDGPVYAGGDIVGFRPVNADGIFLSYLLNAPAAQKQKASRGQGDAVVHISASALSEIQISLPSGDEQRAISGVLEDMDADIQALESRLTKARAVKEGMMQNLLTGRVRLV
jgi:type I restriction enzyme S subunit